ncbi:MAG: hypothetical protein Q8K68_08535 [Nitrospirota bacterium]|nr:hypothetical protein [Nitrospirota bacterium]
MQVVKAIFNGHDIKLLEPVRTRKEAEVLVIFPDEKESRPRADARKLLRGIGRGEHLTEKLLAARAEDLGLERG